MSPQRIQRRRTKGWRMPEGVVYVGRGSKWGNPFKMGVETKISKYPAYLSMPILSGTVIPRDRAEAVRLYRLMFGPHFDFPGLHLSENDIRLQLAGKDLACWCPLVDSEGNAVPCHADVLIELANS